MQKLILPFKRQMILAGYKTAKYLSYWGYHHYGIDISTIQGNAGTDPKIYGSGNGTVVGAGFDNSAGNVVIVVYPSCLNHRTGRVQDLVARYMHLATIAVKTGDAVNTGKVLGVEGNTKSSNYHLHIEFDTDTKWPTYSPQVSKLDDHLPRSQGNFLMKGTDTTVDPSFIFHKTAQNVIVPTIYAPTWLNPQDNTIPLIPAVITPPVDESALDTIKVLEQQVAELSMEVTNLKHEKSVMADMISSIRKIIN